MRSRSESRSHLEALEAGRSLRRGETVGEAQDLALGWHQTENEIVCAPAADGCPWPAVLLEAPPTNTSCSSSASPNCSAARSSREALGSLGFMAAAAPPVGPAPGPVPGCCRRAPRRTVNSHARSAVSGVGSASSPASTAKSSSASSSGARVMVSPQPSCSWISLCKEWLRGGSCLFRTNSAYCCAEAFG